MPRSALEARCKPGQDCLAASRATRDKSCGVVTSFFENVFNQGWPFGDTCRKRNVALWFKNAAEAFCFKCGAVRTAGETIGNGAHNAFKVTARNRYLCRAI